MALKKEIKLKNNFTEMTIALAFSEEISERSFGETVKIIEKISNNN
jgi:hypothetical protein